MKKKKSTKASSKIETQSASNFPIRNITFLLIILFAVLLFYVLGNQKNLELGKTYYHEPTPTSMPTDTPTATPTPNKNITPQSNGTNGQIEWGKEYKLDNETSASKFAPDDHMSTVSELNQSMNLYRQDLGLPTLNFDPLLCNIAQQRANELQALGQLDNHAGFSALAHNQETYDTMDEVLFGGVEPVSGIHIVEWGWAQSLTGHKEAISDPQWHDGCAGISGYFAVFEFGAK